MQYNISIHALREEGDRTAGSRFPLRNHFYPRPPRGGRRCSCPCSCGGCHISIHALREEGDEYRAFRDLKRLEFLSTPSARRATAERVVVPDRLKGISIHALREEGDPRSRRQCRRSNNFYPRPPRGGRRRAAGAGYTGIKISIHALREEGDRSRRP